MRPFLFVVIAVLTSPFFAGGVRAEGAGTCSNYTDRAITQATKASTLKCGFPDHPTWSTDRNVHIRWCRGAKAESVRDAQGVRDRGVSNCEGCKAYADGANRAARENVAFRCGFEGSRWGFGDGGPEDGHYKWCMSGTLDFLQGNILSSGSLKYTSGADVGASENAARAADLRSCRAKIKDRFTIEERKPCIAYAEKAGFQASQNMDGRCGAKPVLRWSGLEREHFEACIFVGEAGKAFLAEEEEIRRKGLEACEKGYLLSDDGHSTGRKGKAAPIVINLKPRTYNTSTNPGPSKGTSTKSTSSGGGLGGNRPFATIRQTRPAGGSDKSQDNAGTNKPAGSSIGGSGAIERLGGGPSGGYDNSRDTKTPGTKSKPSSGGAAIITPAATATPPAASAEPKKQFGRNKGSQDYGFSNPPPPPKPPYVR